MQKLYKVTTKNNPGSPFYIGSYYVIAVSMEEALQKVQSKHKIPDERIQACNCISTDVVV
jgi:hypothetical protein